MKRYTYEDDGHYKQHMTDNNGDWCKWSDVEPLLAERDELLRKLKVYECGKPTVYGLHKCANIAHGVMQTEGHNIDAMRAVDYLRRIAAMGDVGALGSAGTEMGEVK